MIWCGSFGEAPPHLPSLSSLSSPTLIAFWLPDQAWPILPGLSPQAAASTQMVLAHPWLASSQPSCHFLSITVPVTPTTDTPGYIKY